jgi:hypothetical protein
MPAAPSGTDAINLGREQLGIECLLDHGEYKVGNRVGDATSCIGISSSPGYAGASALIHSGRGSAGVAQGGAGPFPFRQPHGHGERHLDLDDHRHHDAVLLARRKSLFDSPDGLLIHSVRLVE